MTDIVRSVMAQEGLFTDCVPNIYRIQDVFGTSRCYCARCSRVWTSHMTWVKFDLRSQRILKNWKQMCVVCSGTVNPYINSDELERMAKLAVDRCVALSNGTFVLRSSNRRMPPHNERACEKCKESGRPCWIIKRKTSPSQSVAGSAAPDSELEALSNDLAKLIVDPSADSSLANSRTESPHDPQLNTGERGLYHSAPPPHVLQHGLMDSYNPAYYHPQQYGHTPMYYPGQPQNVYHTQPTWFHQQPSFSTMTQPVQWY